LKYYFILAAMEGIFVFIVLMLIPPDPKNAWLFGYSKSRLLMAGGIFVVVLFFLGLSVKALRSKEWLRKVAFRIKIWVAELGWFLPFIWGLFILIFFAPYAYLLGRPGLHLVIERMLPVIVWGFLLNIQALILILVFRKDAGNSRVWTKQEEFILEIKPLKGAVVFGIVTILLVGISISFNLVDNIVGDNNLIHYTRKMYLDTERNVPTYYSSMMLFVISGLLAIIAKLKKNENDSFYIYWIILALIFLFFSVDEIAGIHEMLNRPMRKWLNPQGFFSFAWVLVGIPFVLIFALSYLKFFFNLSKKYKWLFAFSAIGYVLGALGFELIGAKYTSIFGWDPQYDIVSTIEETLEMTSLVVMIYALLAYIAEYYDQTKFVLLRVNKQRND